MGRGFGYKLYFFASALSLFSLSFIQAERHPDDRVNESPLPPPSTATLDPEVFPKNCCRCYHATNNLKKSDDDRFLSSCRWWIRDHCDNSEPIAFDSAIASDPQKLSALVGQPVNLQKGAEYDFKSKEKGCSKLKVRFEGHSDAAVGDAYAQASLQICVDVQCNCASCKDFVFEFGGCQNMPADKKDEFKNKLQSKADELRAQGKLPMGLSISMKGNMATAYGNAGMHRNDLDTPFKYNIDVGPQGCSIDGHAKSCDHYKRSIVECFYKVGEAVPTIECEKDNGENETLYCIAKSLSNTGETNKGQWGDKASLDNQKAVDDQENAPKQENASEVPEAVRRASPNTATFTVKMLRGVKVYITPAGRRLRASGSIVID